MNVKVNESEKKPAKEYREGQKYRVEWKMTDLGRVCLELEERIVALERGLEAVLMRMEVSTSPDDEPGWFGVTE